MDEIYQRDIHKKKNKPAKPFEKKDKKIYRQNLT